jgi:hypothetical protein
MFKQFIDKIPGADFFMVTSFLMFFVFFLLVGLYLIFANKDSLRYMANLPLQDVPKDKTPDTEVQ